MFPQENINDFQNKALTEIKHPNKKQIGEILVKGALNFLGDSELFILILLLRLKSFILKKHLILKERKMKNNFFKKTLLLILCLTCCISLLIACSDNSPEPAEDNTKDTQSSDTAPSHSNTYKTSQELITMLEDACTKAEAKKVVDILSEDFPAVGSYFKDYCDTKLAIAKQIELGWCNVENGEYIKLTELTVTEFITEEKYHAEFYTHIDNVVKYEDVNFTMNDLKFYMIDYYEPEGWLDREGFAILVNQDNCWKLLFIIINT